MPTYRILIIIISVALVYLAACAPAPPAPPMTITSQPTTAPTAALPTITPTSAPTAQLEKVTIGEDDVPLVSSLPFDIARGLDLFGQEGLKVTVDNEGGNFQGSDPMVNRLVSGKADFIADGDPTIAAQAQGRELRMIVSYMPAYPTTLFVRSDMKDKIKTVTDLEKQDIVFGTFESKLARYLLVRAGIKPEDISHGCASSLFSCVDRLAQGNYVAAFLDEPYATQLVQTGRYSPLIDLTAQNDVGQYLGGEYEFGLITSAKMIKDHPQTVQRVTNALVKALRYIQTHSAADMVAILPDDVTWQGKPQYTRAIQHMLPAFSKDGIITENGIKNWIEVDKVFGSIKPDAQIDVQALYTNEFINQVK